MLAMEDLVIVKELTHFVKGKRTKRQRPQSPIPLITAIRDHTDDHHNTNSSPETSGMEPATTEEEEDMANCLILLAQGHCKNPQSPKVEDDGTRRFSSKRYKGTVGLYVYQCKTCDRSFPSFQALGGHRASHKKPKAATMAAMVSDDEEPPQYKNHHESSSSLDHLQFSSSISSLKVHECSICGAEFSSGQALGGHMRRHRGPTGTNTTLSLSSSDHKTVVEAEEDLKPKIVLLDLNLPAPEDDHLREPMFGFASKQQQQQQHQQLPLVFSTAPTLVDCHY